MLAIVALLGGLADAAPKRKKRRGTIVLLTDCDMPTEGLHDTLMKLHAAHITVTAVGVQASDRNLLDMIASATDGRLFMLQDATRVGKLAAKLRKLGSL